MPDASPTWEQACSSHGDVAMTGWPAEEASMGAGSGALATTTAALHGFYSVPILQQHSGEPFLVRRSAYEPYQLQHAAPAGAQPHYSQSLPTVAPSTCNPHAGACLHFPSSHHHRGGVPALPYALGMPPPVLVRQAHLSGGPPSAFPSSPQSARGGYHPMAAIGPPMATRGYYHSQSAGSGMQARTGGWDHHGLTAANSRSSAGRAFSVGSGAAAAAAAAAAMAPLIMTRMAMAHHPGPHGEQQALLPAASGSQETAAARAGGDGAHHRYAADGQVSRHVLHRVRQCMNT